MLLYFLFCDFLNVGCLKRNSDDVGWEYDVLVDANNKDKVKCKFCNKVMQGEFIV